jgi:mannose-6-phosphate isomerase-like protein (cupin superfamily)
MIVPAGARHNVRSVGSAPLKLYTLYWHCPALTDI